MKMDNRATFSRRHHCLRLTFALAALILKDRAAAIRRSESPALDRDPFIGRAELDVSDLSIDVMDISAPKTVATVTLTNFGKLKRSFWSCFAQPTSGRCQCTMGLRQPPWTLPAQGRLRRRAYSVTGTVESFRAALISL
jgi:hypothetical protein